MELKEMIAELRDLADDNPNREGAAAAAEALALVAWAEENDLWISRANGEVIVNLPFGRKFMGKSLLGSIRAAKEAYEQGR